MKESIGSAVLGAIVFALLVGFIFALYRCETADCEAKACTPPHVPKLVYHQCVCVEVPR